MVGCCCLPTAQSNRAAVNNLVICVRADWLECMREINKDRALLHSQRRRQRQGTQQPLRCRSLAGAAAPVPHTSPPRLHLSCSPAYSNFHGG
jgi:hypothetical protein